MPSNVSNNRPGIIPQQPHDNAPRKASTYTDEALQKDSYKPNNVVYLHGSGLSIDNSLFIQDLDTEPDGAGDNFQTPLKYLNPGYDVDGFSKSKELLTLKDVSVKDSKGRSRAILNFNSSNEQNELSVGYLVQKFDLDKERSKGSGSALGRGQNESIGYYGSRNSKWTKFTKS